VPSRLEGDASPSAEHTRPVDALGEVESEIVERLSRESRTLVWERPALLVQVKSAYNNNGVQLTDFRV
jgi:hypothetical protein